MGSKNMPTKIGLTLLASDASRQQLYIPAWHFCTMHRFSLRVSSIVNRILLNQQLLGYESLYQCIDFLVCHREGIFGNSKRQLKILEALGFSKVQILVCICIHCSTKFGLHSSELHRPI